MAEYIEREATCKDCIHFDEESRKVKCVHFKNKADVVEVRHERFKWGYQNGQYGIWCTHCGAGWVDSENAEWIAREHDYCPKCGADMRGDKDATN